jgi:tyrosyl-tRNA synthetase
MKRKTLGEQMIAGLEEAIAWAKGEKELKEVVVEKIKLSNLLLREGLAVSMSEGKRVVAQGAVKLNGVIYTNMREEVIIRTGDVLEVGKRKVVLNPQGGFTPRNKITKIDIAKFD